MLDKANNNFIVEDLDDTHLVVQESMLSLLKQELDQVCSLHRLALLIARLY
jgi:hypothetical protein